MTDNYFAAEDAIIERLKEQVPDLKAVSSWGDFDSFVNGAGPSPSAAVIYMRDRVVDGAPSAALVEQIWSVIVRVQAPATASTQKAAREQGGVLVSQVAKALHGWSPAPRHSELALNSGAAANYAKAGFAFFILNFAVRRPVLAR